MKKYKCVVVLSVIVPDSSLSLQPPSSAARLSLSTAAVATDDVLSTVTPSDVALACAPAASAPYALVRLRSFLLPRATTAARCSFTLQPNSLYGNCDSTHQSDITSRLSSLLLFHPANVTVLCLPQGGPYYNVTITVSIVGGPSRAGGTSRILLRGRVCVTRTVLRNKNYTTYKP